MDAEPRERIIFDWWRALSRVVLYAAVFPFSEDNGVRQSMSPPCYERTSIVHLFYKPKAGDIHIFKAELSQKADSKRVIALETRPWDRSGHRGVYVTQKLDAI